MCFPKAPDPVSVPERQAAQQPQVGAATRATGQDDLKRKRGYAALISAGSNAALAPATTTPTTLGG